MSRPVSVAANPPESVPPVPAEAPRLRLVQGRRKRGPLRPARLVPVRSRIGPQTAARAFQSLDMTVLTVLAVLAAGGATGGPLLTTELGHVAPFVVGAVAAAIGLRASAAYAYNRSERPLGHLLRVTTAFAAAGVAALAAAWLFTDGRSARAVLVWTGSAALLVGVLHLGAYDLTRAWRRNGRMTPNLVFVGATPAAGGLIQAALATREVSVLGVFDDRAARAPVTLHGVPVLGDLEALLEHRLLPYVDRIVITVTDATEARTRALVDRLRNLPNEVTLLLPGDGRSLERITDAPLAFVDGQRSDDSRAFGKRVQDVVLAVIGLLLTAPLFAAVALAVRLDSPGPILFRQKRHGFNNEVITVWKFRSMRVEASDANARRQVTKDDDRVTRVGRFIRKTSLDELPQIFNVLRGEMSVVGPRPHAIGMMTGEAEASKLVAHYAHRHRIKPGITGWAQIHGSRGPVHTSEEVAARVALDVEYIERRSLWLDLYIVLVTVPRLLGDKAAIR
ncbi:MAG: exopolysaccharide biosynthesis polyprenyl glycosylphosphotransferase [Proteobacteria bacterium]|nr:exopolysaccharide biosynthesis polyprenyl glycosylphosphotransferase [Pseudomonadota bacterium]